MAIEANPNASQRELSQALGLSLSKASYCIKALMEKGRVKAGSFKASPHKGKYLYLLTPLWLEVRACQTLSFLRPKQAEYDLLKAEIVAPQQEMETRP